MVRALIVEYQDVSRNNLRHMMSRSDLASFVDIAANTAVVVRDFATNSYAIIILGHGTSRLDLIELQVADLKKRFPRARVLLYGPYDLDYSKYKADGFVSNRDAATLLVDTIRRAIRS